MNKITRLKKLLKSVGEFERFQKQEMERLRIEVEAAHRDREECFLAADRISELLPGSRSIFRRVEEARVRIQALERKLTAVRKRLLRTRATQKAIGARLDQLEISTERRGNELSLDAFVAFDAGDPVSRKYARLASAEE